MAKLYPPGLKGTLPAFTNPSQLVIPFTPNKTIGNNENFISGFSLILKDVNNNSTVAKVESTNFDLIKNEVVFEITDSALLKIGRFYKAQIAYIHNNEVGFYSTVGVIKYTAIPKMSITGLTTDYYNHALLKYVGVYTNDDDSTEKVYSYSFIIKDSKGQVFAEVSNLIHNHSFDTALNESTDEFVCEKEMELNKNYYITYKVQTTNGLIASSPNYTIKLMETEAYTGPVSLTVSLDEENAYMSVVITNTKGIPVSGKFSICRACSKDDYAIWNEIYRIGFDSENFNNKEILKDFSIEHGYGYRYSIQQYNKYGYYSEKHKTEAIYAKFEHIYLFDGQRQLKIKYNPKINSMKIIKQESKTETIGSKYPYFFRNGKVSYKELPVGGLISYLSDEQELFLTDEELFKETFQTIKNEPFDWFNQEYDKKLENSHRETGLTDGNVKAEKVFRDEVLSFLTDGKYKIFKSPTEGNMIVYTMNISLSPNTTVGRMIYDFSATVYECMDYTYENLCNYNFLTYSLPLTGNDKYKTIMTNYLVNYYNQMIAENNKVITEGYLDITYGYDIYSVDIRDAAPGTKYIIDGEKIIIGVSGQYSIEFNRPISSLRVIPTLRSGFVTFRYKQETYNPFNIIHGIYMEKMPIFKQAIGKHHLTEEKDNSLDIFEDFNYIRFSRRNVFTLYVKQEDLAYEVEVYNENSSLDKIFIDDENQVFYTDLNCKNKFDNEKFLQSVIYEIYAVSIDEKIKRPISSLVFYVSYDDKTYPRISHYYKTLDENSSWDKYLDKVIKVKWDWANTWLDDIEIKNETEFNYYIKSPMYEKVAEIPYMIEYEKINQPYKYEDHTFYKESDYQEYYLMKKNNKIFIAPHQYDCKISIGVITPAFSIDHTSIDIDKDITFKISSPSNIEYLNTGWGVICEYMYTEKRRLYGFDGYNTIEKKFNSTAEYIDYVNRLEDLLYFYSIGDSAAERKENEI